jgi:hypothetical protein
MNFKGLSCATVPAPHSVAHRLKGHSTETAIKLQFTVYSLYHENENNFAY